MEMEVCEITDESGTSSLSTSTAASMRGKGAPRTKQSRDKVRTVGADSSRSGADMNRERETLAHATYFKGTYLYYVYVTMTSGGAACSHADCGLRQEVDVLTAVIVLLLLFSVRFFVILFLLPNFCFSRLSNLFSILYTYVYALRFYSSSIINAGPCIDDFDLTDLS